MYYLDAFGGKKGNFAESRTRNVTEPRDTSEGRRNVLLKRLWQRGTLGDLVRNERCSTVCSENRVQVCEAHRDQGIILWFAVVNMVMNWLSCLTGRVCDRQLVKSDTAAWS